MSGNFQNCSWQTGPYLLELANQDGNPRLNHQTRENDLLSTLAAAGFKEASACALDLVFNDDQGDDIYDAYAAFSFCPIDNPPAKHRAMFQEVDWTSDTPSKCRYAIILAASKAEYDRDLLYKLLKTLHGDFRDAALYAASSFSEWRFIEIVASIALSLESGQLQQLPISLASSQRCRRLWKRPMNFIVCRERETLPFPEEGTSGNQ